MAAIAAIHDRGVINAPAAIIMAHVVGRWVALALTYGCHWLSDEGDEKVSSCQSGVPWKVEKLLMQTKSNPIGNSPKAK